MSIFSIWTCPPIATGRVLPNWTFGLVAYISAMTIHFWEMTRFINHFANDIENQKWKYLYTKGNFIHLNGITISLIRLDVDVKQLRGSDRKWSCL